MSALDLNDLSVTFPDGTQAVRGVSLSVNRGEILSVVGESGSGKSTVLGAIAGLLPRKTVVSGRLHLEGGDNLLAKGASRKGIAGKRIAMVFQNPAGSLNPVVSVGDHVAEVLATHHSLSGAALREATQDLLARVGIPDPATKARAFPHQLSGGQKQRIAIAAALAGDPAVLLADEPTTALDATVQARILDVLLGLVDERGLALIFVTHDLAVAASIGDKIAVMRGGEIVEAGPSRATLAAPSVAYTAALVRASAPRGFVPRVVPFDKGPTLDLASVTRRFGGRAPVTALNDVSLTLHRGEILGLIGESGSGKSTLGRIAVGLDAPDEGRVTLGGEALRPGHNPAQRAAVQMVFQDALASFNPRMRVGESIAIPLRIHHGLRGADGQARVAKLLEDVGLDPALATRRPNELSGGQLQRAAIARALATDPDWLICDEAVASLDVQIRGQILDLLEKLRDGRNLGILFISHDLGVVRDIAARTVVLHRGKLVEQGPTGALMDNPAQAYTRRLLAAIPRATEPWRDRAGRLAADNDLQDDEDT